MAPVRVFFILAACVLLTHHTFTQNNNAPCLPSTRRYGYDTFVRRHIRSDTPKSLDQNEWQRYIRKKRGCNRPTQSFLQPKDLDRVKEVCTRKGGMIHKRNLCISRRPFTFFTVRIDRRTCRIRSVRVNTKHLILACDRLDNRCLPVHFEGNPHNLTPKYKTKACQAPKA